ncbi:hypothetical protein HMPREF1870_01668, partial [Bacteroidales bacterium KA00344]
CSEFVELTLNYNGMFVNLHTNIPYIVVFMSKTMLWTAQSLQVSNVS